MDELKDSAELIASTVESIEEKQDQMLEDLELLKYELDHTNSGSFTSKLKEALIRLQAAVDALAEAKDDSVRYQTY
ncbi:MAG: hypothetical protein WCK64_05915 [Synechococcaceae cyanobacterium ELA445]